ncbi:MAG: GAF domain-containing protein, partial [Syntrophales bacterium LBB04]|nr:GAF domain-containing protein [Syntrophales bacterium LBB04]
DFRDKFIMVLPVSAFSQVQALLLCEYGQANAITDSDQAELIDVFLVQLSPLCACLVETQRLEDKARSLELLYEIGSVLSSIRDEDQLLEAILRLVEKYLLVDRCSLMIIDEDRKNLRIKKAFGINDLDIHSVKVPLGVGIAGHVAMGTQPLLINDITAESGLVSQVKNREEFRTNSLLSVPLVSQGEVIGVINVNDRKDGQPFTESDMELLSKIGSEIAAVLQRSYMALQLKKARELDVELIRFMPM